MKIAGTAVLDAPAEQVWAALNDPAVLARTIPGCEQLEALGPDHYRMTITAGVASIKGTYLGDVQLGDPSPPDSFTLRAAGSGAPGTVSAAVRITLSCPDGLRTTVSYEADAVVGGAVGGVGQRVLSAVAKRTATEFFAAVGSVLNSDDAVGPANDPGAGRTVATPAAPEPGPADRSPTDAGPGTVFTRPTPLPATAPGPAGTVTAALAGGAIALIGVLIGWTIGRRR